MGRPTTVLTKAIHAIGMSTADFAKEKLDLTYQTFSYRIRQGHLSLEDYHRICYWTGLSFEDLFPNPYKPITPKVPESITIPRQGAIPTKKPQPQPPLEPTPSSSKEQKKEEAITAPSAPSPSFQLIEAFPGGLPPMPVPELG
jgi:hypothetical protein